MCNLGIFTTLVYSSPSILRTRGILGTMSKMYDRPFSTEPCVTMACSKLEAYSEPGQI